ncbi:hypothetical protein ACQYJA_005127, partial [Escherichia coli]
FNDEFSLSSYEFLTKVINPAREEAGENPVSNKDFINRVKDELDLKEENFLLLDTGASGRKASHTILNGDQLLLVGMRESKAVRRKVLDYIRRIEKDKQLLEDSLPEGKIFRLALPQGGYNKVSPQTLIIKSQSHSICVLLPAVSLSLGTLSRRQDAASGCR